MCPALSGLSAFCLHAEMFLRGQWEMLVAVCCPGLSCWGAGRSTQVEGAEGLETPRGRMCWLWGAGEVTGTEV